MLFQIPSKNLKIAFQADFQVLLTAFQTLSNVFSIVFAPAETVLVTSFHPSANGLAIFSFHHLLIELITLASIFWIGFQMITAKPTGKAIEINKILPKVLNKASAPLTNAFQPFFNPASILEPTFSISLTALPTKFETDLTIPLNDLPTVLPKYTTAFTALLNPLATDLPKFSTLFTIPFTNSRNFALCLYSSNSATPSTVIAVIIIPNGLVNKNLPADANAEPSPRKAPPNLVRLDAPTTPSLNIIFLPTSNAVPPKSISV